ncbi:hypothetical protein VTO42DRAFT_3744 [Malbranchea cinnamomea]
MVESSSVANEVPLLDGPSDSIPPLKLAQTEHLLPHQSPHSDVQNPNNGTTNGMLTGVDNASSGTQNGPDSQAVTSSGVVENGAPVQPSPVKQPQSREDAERSRNVPSRTNSSASGITRRRRGSHQGESSPVAGTVTPTRRRSVQFARTSDNEAQGASNSRASSFGPLDGDAQAKDRRNHQSLLSKLRAFAASSSFPSHSRSASAVTIGPDTADGRLNNADHPTPGSERGEFRFPWTHDESEADADAESSSGEQRTGLRKKMKRKIRRSKPESEPHTAPSTPRASDAPPLPSSFSNSRTADDYVPSRFRRRPIASALALHGGVSEDEGRERLNREGMWGLRSGWIQSARAMSYSGQNRQEHLSGPEDRRPGHLRRFTGLGTASDYGESLSAAWRKHKAERGTSLSAQRWRQIKAGLKSIGQRRKAEATVDHVKSAELLAELASGVPAALLLASMFQRDEHGSRRIPILLEQLKVRVTDSEIDSRFGDRHLVFRIELEYGSGITRMNWVIHRTLRDFANLHLKYKMHIGAQKYIQLKGDESGNTLPHFPRGAFPYLRGVRGLESDPEDEDDEGGDETAGEATSGNERAKKKKKQKNRRSLGGISRQGSGLTHEEAGNAPGSASNHGDGQQPGPSTPGPVAKREPYPERQRKKLEVYLQKMIRFLMFRADSNRLCKFLELSTLGVRLAAEGTYHGKEGFLVIQSSKGLDFRKALKPSLIKSRHSPKWFLVRHSYIVCVDSPEDMHIYDVFLVDPYFQLQSQKVRLRDQNAKEIAKTAKESAAHPKHHTLKIQNAERKMRLLARNERQLHQFEESIRFMVDNTPWSKPNRFNSFAPVRHNCFAQWLVDGRDYMWVVSRAINQAKDVIYIHDWWLSPELYLRRPPAISQKWRLDRLLQKKAQQGVKIFVIMYRNINTAMPIDSEYSKFSLLDLHPNVFVQRSPNQFRQNTLFWAHHEKLCLIDHTIAFIGGIDLCFGRWDTPQHLCTDDKMTGFEPSDLPKDADHCQLWPGKDYSNPRVQDFYELNKPYEEMYDRNVVPRMPWHDIAMHVVGQPARDLTRHFVQRWNYILRQRKPTRPTPFLLPPPDFNPADLEALGLDGTCEIQILRSCGMWSMGTPDVTEHSIMNAYVKLIEKSEHFVYIENQFFITSCEIDGKRIENHIGDALVERIVRAARNDEDWRAVILVPLMPGFQNRVDTEGGTSVRLIMQAQYRSICRGETSIFGRLRAQGIEPEDYIQFFSLRSWGKIGPRKHLVTEQLYIHAKCMIVDDRVAIIGSANINERSMLGSRDSECAAIVRDTDMLWSSMNGKPYLVGRFPHTLRMRLMREHLGIDVDEVLEQELAAEAEARRNKATTKGQSPDDLDDPMDAFSVSSDKLNEREFDEQRLRFQDECLARSEQMHSFNHDVDWEQANNPNLKTNKKLTADSRVTRNVDHRKDLEGDGVDNMKALSEAGFLNGRDSYLTPENAEILVSSEHRPSTKQSSMHPLTPAESSPGQSKSDGDRPASGGSAKESESSPKQKKQFQNRSNLPHLTVDAHDPLHPQPDRSHPLASEIVQPTIDKDCMKDPLIDSFYFDIWQATAENNTKLFRTVFRCMPDSEVKTWKDYKEYDAYAERFADIQNSYYYDDRAPHLIARPLSMSQSGPVGAGTTTAIDRFGAEIGKVRSEIKEKVTNHVSSEAAEEEALKRWASEANKAQLERQVTQQLADLADADEQSPSSTQGEKAALKAPETKSLNSTQSRDNSFPTVEVEKSAQNGEGGPSLNASQSVRKRRRATTRGSKREFHASDDIMSMPEAEELLNMVQGHLVLWPYEWLEKEEQGGNWLYTFDQISPLEIYI